MKIVIKEVMNYLYKCVLIECMVMMIKEVWIDVFRVVEIFLGLIYILIG